MARLENYQAIVNSCYGIGTVCVEFDKNTPNHTVLDLKYRLAEITSHVVEQQRITTLGGHLLSDDHRLFSGLEGPAVFNVSVCLRGGRSPYSACSLGDWQASSASEEINIALPLLRQRCDENSPEKRLKTSEALDSASWEMWECAREHGASSAPLRYTEVKPGAMCLPGRKDKGKGKETNKRKDRDL
ncbi:hypothetical protein BDF14DRAFT_1794533 [Spinellus fusiger]|nr:hypothetical protein BDF14DRAFT_1794533 [Spinellus fusiger]